jgi:hypothetical protein
MVRVNAFLTTTLLGILLFSGAWGGPGPMMGAVPPPGPPGGGGNNPYNFGDSSHYSGYYTTSKLEDAEDKTRETIEGDEDNAFLRIFEAKREWIPRCRNESAARVQVRNAETVEWANIMDYETLARRRIVEAMRTQPQRNWDVLQQEGLEDRIRNGQRMIDRVLTQVVQAPRVVASITTSRGTTPSGTPRAGVSPTTVPLPPPRSVSPIQQAFLPPITPAEQRIHDIMQHILYVIVIGQQDLDFNQFGERDGMLLTYLREFRDAEPLDQEDRLRALASGLFRSLPQNPSRADYQ